MAGKFASGTRWIRGGSHGRRLGGASASCGEMELIVKSKAAKLVLIALEIVVFLPITFWVGKTYFAAVVSRRLDAESLRLATRLDPDNSDYHLKLGRIYQYSLTDINSAAALEELSRAAELSPLDAQTWLDLGAAQELQGRLDEAESSLRRADELAPNLPNFQWAIGNFFLLRGNLDEALRHFKVVLAGDRQYDQAIFSTAWKAVGDGDKILATLIPDSVSAQVNYLYYLVNQSKSAEAAKVWARIAANLQGFDPVWANPYIDWLMRNHQPDEAHQVWTELQKRQLVSESAAPGNLVSNGDFEGGLENMGFGWRVYGVPGVYVGLDSTVFHSSGHSLVISFPGTENFFYQGVYQWVKVAPGVAYQARAYMKTDGITTDSGPRLEVMDTLDSRALNQFSPQVRGTNADWTLLTVEFTPKETHYVTVCIARVPSEKLDNKVAGRVWVDDVSVSPVRPKSATATGP
jgi:tetratricopeptide repeat protein